MQQFDLSDILGMDQRFRANFINSLGGFKSVGLVGTADIDRKTNLSVVSSLFHIGANPPLCGMIIRPETEERHTLDNIMETLSYTFNHIHEGILTSAHQAAAKYPREVSEFEQVGLTPMFVDQVHAPFVEESKVKFAMTLEQRIDLHINGTILLLGKIVACQIPEHALCKDGFLDLEKSGTVTCSGLDTYHSTNILARLSYPRPEVLPTQIPIDYLHP